MRHVLGLRAVGAALSAAGGLWAASAFAQDAGVDAGGGDAGRAGEELPIEAGALIYPASGATDVVLNPGLILRLEQTTLEPPSDRRRSSEPPALGEGLLLRDDAGQLIAAGEMLTLETPRPFASTEALANAQVEIATRTPLELLPQAHYVVLSRVAICPRRDGVRTACLREEYVEIGDFTTGTQVDRQGPVIAAFDQGPSPGACLAALSVVASDDHAAPGALRFRSDAVAFLGPDLVLPTPAPTGSGLQTTLSLVPVDPSNNRGPALEVDVDACPGLAVEDGFFSDLLPAPPPPATPVREAESQGGSCAVAPGLASTSFGGGALSFALLVLATAFRRARPRRPLR